MDTDIVEIKPAAPPATPPLPPRLERSWGSWRSLFNVGMTVLTVVATLIAIVPLFSVLYMLLREGLDKFSWSVFTTLPAKGGFGNAIVGTLVMVGLAAALSVPIGILVGIYLSEFGGEGKGATAIRFSAKVMTGIPSILAGVFAYALVVAARKQFSAIAGGVALAILMLPVVILTAEEALRQVPRKMREAAYGLGCTHTQVVLKIVLPTALPGVLTGVMLAVARAAGETAPLLFTALFSEQWFAGDLSKQTASLAVFIYNFARRPSPEDVKLAWTASLVLVAVVLAINILAQQLTKGSKQHQR